MRAVGITRYGSADVVEVVEVPDPELGAGELLVRVAAASVNPSDVMVREGEVAIIFEGIDPPWISGLELAGHVEAVAPDVSGWERGDAVAAFRSFIGNGRGAQAELAVVPAASAVHVPAGLTMAQACTLPMNGLTARAAVDEVLAAGASTLVVGGAAGVVGGYATALAAAAGLHVVALAGPADEALVRELGAAEFVARSDDPAGAVRALYPDGVDAAIDAVVIGLPLAGAVRDGGRYVALRHYDGDPGRGVVADYLQVTDFMHDTPRLQAVMDAAEAGVLVPRIAATYPPEGAAEAHRRVEAGGLRGKIVVEF